MKIKQLEKLMEVDKVEEDSELVLYFPKPNGVFEQNENLISIKNVSFGWPNGDPLFTNVDFTISPRSRIAILGKNGWYVYCVFINKYILYCK